MTKIQNLIKFHALANEYLELQDLYKDVVIDLPDEVLITVTWRIDGTSHFKSRDIPISDFVGVNDKLKRKIQYQKNKTP